jgi:hypothetical protein
MTENSKPLDAYADEADEFVVLLGSRELAAAADERLLVHLLLRADSINRKALHWRRLKVTVQFQSRVGSNSSSIREQRSWGCAFAGLLCAACWLAGLL